MKTDKKLILTGSTIVLFSSLQPIAYASSISRHFSDFAVSHSGCLTEIAFACLFFAAIILARRKSLE